MGYENLQVTNIKFSQQALLLILLLLQVTKVSQYLCVIVFQPLFVVPISFFNVFFLFFFFYQGFLSQSFTNYRASGEGGKGISLTSHCYFHPLHRHFNISRTITADSSLLHIGSSQTRSGNLWFPSSSR